MISAAETRLTVRDALEQHYLPAASDISPMTRKKLRHNVTRWERHTDDPAIEDITVEDFDRFRASCLEMELSPDTIETTLSDVLTILRYCCERHHLIARIPYIGRKLRRRRSIKHVPLLSDLAKLYENAHVPTWPKLHVSREVFWQAWLVTEYFTGLRLEDSMTKLLWENVTDEHVIVQAHKTGKIQLFPMHPVWMRHLLPLRGRDPRVFPLPKSPHLMRRELRNMSEAAELSKKVTPQSLRRLAGTMWQKAKHGAGQMLLGHTLGVSDRYIVPLVLQDAIKTLQIPRQWMTAGEIENRRGRESQILETFRKLSESQQGMVLGLADSLLK